MDPRVYSREELLKLREELPRRILDKLQSGGTAAKDPNGGNMSSAKDRRPKKANEDISSSAESDEVIFQGKKSHQHSQWQYRGRTGSEINSTEPVSAPIGLGAQKSEGFQRFFKAVVSPTHVRVTAGGRIVPNTRGSVSPTAKWDKERSALVGQDSTETSKDEKSASSNGIGTTFPHPLISPPLTGHPQLIHHHLGVPMPLYFPHGLPMAYGIPPHWQGRQPVPSQIQQELEDTEKTLKSQDGAGDKKPRPAPIKIAPRSETDSNRPFYHNGNVIYPPGYGPSQGAVPMVLTSPYFPPGMTGHPAFANAHAASMGQLSPATPMFTPVASPAVCPPLSSHNNQLQPSSVVAPGFTPHITSIRPSEITKRQLESLRTSLKYYKDQQQFNKHQIDEKWVAQEVQKLEKSVKEFEYNYDMQSKFEAMHYPQHHVIHSGRSSARSRRGHNDSRNSSMSTQSRGRGQANFHSYERGASMSSNRKRNRHAIGINSNIEQYVENMVGEKVEALEKSRGEKGTGLLGNASVVPKSKPGLKPAYTPRCDDSGLQARLPVGLPTVGVPPSDRRSEWNNTCAPGMYLNNGLLSANTQLSPMNPVPGGYSQPYLIGSLPRGLNPHTAHADDYVYSRPLTEEEKKARSNYWGHFPGANGVGLPKFDGKDFYPPSPVKANGASAQPIHHQQLMTTAGFSDIDPFNSTRGLQGTRTKESGHRVSKAIPIVAPKDATQRESTASRPSLSAPRTEKRIEVTKNLSKWMGDVNLSAEDKLPDDLASKTKQSKVGRQAIERSSSRSGNELWHTMLKKGSTSGAALPSAVSSTTATAYLPQYHGHAAASLGPTISNANGHAPQASPDGSKTADRASSHLSAEKVGENRRPSETRSEEYDPLKDIQERMLRDAERRGVIGSDW
ncbi:hypothetical protein ABKA04_002857 [Annulohypoxylon sp. FPYF3050]